LQRVYWDVHEQKNAPTTKQIAAMNIAPDSAPIAESGIVSFDPQCQVTLRFRAD